MKRRIEKTVVLGAGTMGSRIAAHFANAGLPCILLDIVPPNLSADAPSSERNKIVRAGLDAAKKSKPAAFFTPALADKIAIGNFEDDLGRCAEADWIIEVVAENLEIKRKLLTRVAQFRKPGAIVTTNTSGLPVHLIAEGMNEEFQQHWAGTHFFNPPRYLKLVEVIPGPKTLKEVVESLSEFCDRRLGKGVVVAKDTPNFIANRIGTFSMLNALRLMGTLGMTVEEVDACTGPAVGWPKSATFRTADIVGLDVLVHVVKNIYETAPNDESREMYKVPALVEEMAKRGWLGDKTGQGFYKKVKGEGQQEILTLDVNTMEYRSRQKAKFGSLEMGKAIEDTRERLRALVGPVLEGQKGDKAQQFLWRGLSETCLYAARRVPEISDNIVDVDRALRWGFGWELGPFEIMDAVGVKAFAGQVQREGRALSAVVEKVLASGRKGFYESEKGTTTVFDMGSGGTKKVEEPMGVIILKSLKDAGREVERNSGASLIDLGDGVACCEFHAKMNAIGADLIAMLHKGLKRLETDFDALVIANQAVNFSVGANLMLVLVGAQEQEWDELHAAVKQFQNINLAIKYAPKPVVAAPQGMALGGGCEVSLHASRIQAAAEAYIGLVETGVGLIPGGGGTKEMLIRANERTGGTALSLSSSPETDLDLFHALKPIFETIAMAKVGTSAEECRDLGYLRREDGLSMNRDRLVADAKEAALSLVRGGYKPLAASWQEGARSTQIKVLGEQFLAGAKLAIHMMFRGGYASEYDAHVGRKLANILAGGALTSPQLVNEQYVLDLEREAFVSLCGEKKTQERIAHTLKTGKPLRN
ncbi:MAG: 3-hydroxyacyl-CoA dehydrogenase [Acidobacteria bacterium]|nr:MAG: 3-hydroxyacyl-CoA dehydrogenase [Acidobacteriota bacterium]PYU70540.1 MAG: 3-hydroxyacyl-CoA dehydrogenase [Acidobacteriota bacterium]